MGENRIRPGDASGRGLSGEPGRNNSSRNATPTVKSPSMRKMYCHPRRPCAPSSLRMPDASNGLMAFPPNMPKKKMATRLESSFLVYHADRVYAPPGMYPPSATPRIVRTARKPARFLTRTCKVATMPKIRTCAESHFRGPHCGCQHNTWTLLTHTLQQNIEGDLKQDNRHEHELVAEVDRRLRDLDVLEKSTREGASDIHTVQLEDEEAEEQQREHCCVDSGVSRPVAMGSLTSTLPYDQCLPRGHCR